MSGSWAIALSQPGAERAASRHLRRHDFTHHVFRIRQVAVTRGRRRETTPTAFPPYVFVWLDHLARLSALLRVPRITGLLRNDDGLPALWLASEVEGLLARADAEGCLRPDPTAPPVERFLPGQRVRVEAGPMQGYNAIFECRSGEERANILMSMFGRQSRAVVDLADLTEEQSRRRDQDRRDETRRRRPRRREAASGGLLYPVTMAS